MVSHVRQLAVLLSRNSASLTSSGSRTLTQASRTRLTWCRLRGREPGLKRLHHGSSVVLQDHQSETSEAVSSGKGLTLSDNCVKQMLKVTEDEPDLMLRVTVDGGGCSGFQYTINFDTTINSDDRVFEREGVKVVADQLTLELVDGCTIDYHTELIKSAFKIVGNPKAESTCSCGTSFAPK